VRSSSRAALAAAAVAAATTLAACGTSTTGPDDDTLRVVASTNVWGSVAQAVAGDRIEVESLITEPSADPHSYESSPLDAAAISDASLVVYNGGGYDQFVEDILESVGGDPATVEAFALFESGEGADLHSDHGDEHAHEPTGGHATENTGGHATENTGASAAEDTDHSHDGHDHSGVNEHVWYDLATADAVAHAVADRLSELDPEGADTYQANAAAFHDDLHGISDLVESIAADHADAPVAQTESIATYLVTAAGLRDAVSADFANAIENGTDPSPAAIAATRQLLLDKQVRALLYNPQTEDKVSREMRTVAEASGIPVVEVSETLPEGLDYIQWQNRTAEALASALDTES